MAGRFQGVSAFAVEVRRWLTRCSTPAPSRWQPTNHSTICAARRVRLRAAPAGSSGSSLLRAPGRKEPWLAAVYLLVQFPIGLAAFIYAVTVVSVGAGTIVVALAGLVLLAAFMYSLQPYGELQRWLSNALLGTHIAPLPFGDERGPLWSLQRLKARVTNTMTWRLFVFVFLQFGLCIAGFVVAVVFLSLPLAFVSAPISVATGGDTWGADTAGGPVACASGHPRVLHRRSVALGRRLGLGVINTASLGTQHAGISGDGPTVVERARAAAGAWNNPGAPVVLDSGWTSARQAPALERPALEGSTPASRRPG